MSDHATRVIAARRAYEAAQRSLYEKRAHRQAYTDAEIAESCAFVELCFSALVEAVKAETQIGSATQATPEHSVTTRRSAAQK